MPWRCGVGNLLAAVASLTSDRPQPGKRKNHRPTGPFPRLHSRTAVRKPTCVGGCGARSPRQIVTLRQPTEAGPVLFLACSTPLIPQSMTKPQTVPCACDPCENNKRRRRGEPTKRINLENLPLKAMFIFYAFFFFPNSHSSSPWSMRLTESNRVSADITFRLAVRANCVSPAPASNELRVRTTASHGLCNYPGSKFPLANAERELLPIAHRPSPITHCLSFMRDIRDGSKEFHSWHC